MPPLIETVLSLMRIDIYEPGELRSLISGEYPNFSEQEKLTLALEITKDSVESGVANFRTLEQDYTIEHPWVPLFETGLVEQKFSAAYFGETEFEWATRDGLLETPLTFEFPHGEANVVSSLFQQTLQEEKKLITSLNKNVVFQKEYTAINHTTLKNARELYTHEGLLHRLDGPAVITKNGTKQYWEHGVLHRLNGPAVTWVEDGAICEQYWVNGQLHRSDGPAVITKNGTKQYWIKGEKVDLL